MSASRTTRHTTRRSVAAGSATVVTGLLLTLGGPAAADPPALDFDPCVNTLERAGQWPGVLSDGTRLYSDAFDSYLSRQPACSPGT